MAKLKSLLERLTENVTMHSEWNPSRMFVNAAGSVCVGNRLKEMQAGTPLIDKSRDRCVIRGMPNEDYHRERKHLSSSALKVFEDNPYKYHRIYVRGDVPEPNETNDKLIGSITHSILLDGDEGVLGRYELYPTEVQGIEINRRLKDHREYLADFEADCLKRGVTPMTEEQYLTAEGLAAAARKCDEAAAILDRDDLVREVSCFAYDQGTGLRIKARFDLLAWHRERFTLVDFKTSCCANPQKFIRKDVQDYRYDLSGALYCKVFHSLTGVMPAFIWVVLVKDDEGDYQCYACTLSDNSWMQAGIDCDRALEQCCRAGLSAEFVSPYAKGIHVVDLPHFRLRGERE